MQQTCGSLLTKERDTLTYEGLELNLLASAIVSTVLQLFSLTLTYPCIAFILTMTCSIHATISICMPRLN